jgi:DNA polymerase V
MANVTLCYTATMIGLMDCNNFFVSCERLFRPDLRGKPVAVLSSNDGCIVARSQEVKDLGISMGVPYFEVKDLCEKHSITLFSSNFALYRDLSSRVMEALQEECEDIEVYSIDEAFFPVEESTSRDEMFHMRERIMKKTGIPVSFGIAPTKTIAKIANAEAKKGGGVVLLTSEDAKKRYSSMLCGSVWGIGLQTSGRLSKLNIRTVEEFVSHGLFFARQEFGVVGERLYLELTGIRTDTHEDLEPSLGSIMSTRSFHAPITEKNVLLSALGHHVTQLGEKLRARRVTASTVRIICAPSRFSSYILRTSSLTQELEMPTHDTTTLLKVVGTLLDRLYENDVPYKKAGVVVSGLIPEEYVSPSIFEAPHKESNSVSLDHIVDTLNKRFGRGVVHSGTVMRTEAWSSRSDARSPAYTTQWQDIAKVKAV